MLQEMQQSTDEEPIIPQMMMIYVFLQGDEETYSLLAGAKIGE